MLTKVNAQDEALCQLIRKTPFMLTNYLITLHLVSFVLAFIKAEDDVSFHGGNK